jgi:hypothetical protein
MRREVGGRVDGEEVEMVETAGAMWVQARHCWCGHGVGLRGCHYGYQVGSVSVMVTDEVLLHETCR